ncbi:cytochrome b [Novosphingobium rosa]|uniref:cytochrome b n=1 Tax=Novosphingobium rosa TaxID=76978 RepID=UPI00082BA5F0|nr:cytochrome b [Novosphingobium rosa]
MPRYSVVAILLHWLIAALILTNLALGWWMQTLEGLAQFEKFQLHKSIGILVLLLSMLRLLWRAMHKAPPYPETMKPWEKLAASSVHWLLYAIMIGMPLTGWLLVSTSAFNLPTLLFHMVPWPHLPVHDWPMEARMQLNHLSEGTHKALAFGTAGLVALHVGAALKHQIIARDKVLSRMLPRFGRAA